MDTNAAYWTEDANGNLLVYNGQGQFLDRVPKAAAPTFVARFSQGQRDMAKDYSPEAQSSGGSGGSNGPAWANIGLRGQELNQSAAQFGQRLSEEQRQFNERFHMDKAIHNNNLGEQQRQFNERMGMDKSMFDQRMGLETATQKWREAVDARDFEAANFWKARAQEIQQNQLAMQYTNLLANQTGPQDWIKYGRLSRGESPVSDDDGKTVPLDQAIPPWARGMTPGSMSPTIANGPAWARPQTAQPQQQQSQAQQPQPVTQQPITQQPTPQRATIEQGAVGGAGVTQVTKDGTTTAPTSWTVRDMPGAKNPVTFDAAQWGGALPSWFKGAVGA